jgi:hypothetical protein
MLLRLFKGSGPGVIFLIAVTCIAVWLGALLHPASPTDPITNCSQMPLYEMFLKLIGQNARLQVAVSLFLVAAMAFLLVNFNTRSFFINERTYLPALIYILAGGLFPEYQSLNPAIPASLFLMFAIIRIIDGYRKPGVANNFFDAGILISTGSLFYGSLIWFGVLVIIGIVLIRSVSFSEIAISISGLLTPYLMTFGIWYVSGKDLRDLLSIINNAFFIRSEGYFFSRITIVAIIFSSIMVIVSLAFLFGNLNNKKIKSRKIFSLLVWLFLISVAVYIIMPPVSVEIIWIIAIPASYFLTHYFIFMRKKLIPEIFISLFFILVAIIHIFYLK